MIRRLPVIPTIVVRPPSALMIGLGVWQFNRQMEGRPAGAICAGREGAADHLADGAAAQGAIAAVSPRDRVCLQPIGRRAAGGESATGEPGFVQIVDCRTGTKGR